MKSDTLCRSGGLGLYSRPEQIPQTPQVATANPLARDVTPVRYRGISPKIRQQWSTYKRALRAVKAARIHPDLNDFVDAIHEMQKSIMDEIDLRRSTVGPLDRW